MIFFPLYPMLIRTLGGKAHAAVAGILLSQVLCLASLVLMSAMAHGDRRVPLFQEPGFWLLINPFGVFFLALYTESLFLLLTLVHFAAYERSKRRLSIASGFLAGLTRPTSIVLPVLLGTEAVQRFRKREPWGWVVIAAAAPLVGVGVFVFGIIAIKTGDVFGYVHMSTQFWQHTPAFPLYPYVEELRSAVTTVLARRIPPPDLLLRVVSTPAVIGILVWQRRRLPPSWMVYCVAALLFMHSVTPWRGSGRYEAVLFPVFFALAGSKLATSKAAWAIATLMVAGWFVALYQLTTWRWLA